MTNSSPKRMTSCFKLPSDKGAISRLRLLNFFGQRNKRRRSPALSGQRFEFLEDRNLFAGDAFAVAVEAPFEQVEQVEIAPELHTDLIFEAAPLGDETIELPPQLEELRQQLGDEGFAQWLTSNNDQFGSLQGFSESQVNELFENHPEGFAQFESTEQLLADWLRAFEGGDTCPGDDNCDGVTDEDQVRIDEAFRLRPELWQPLFELGEEAFVLELESNNTASGNYQNIDLVVIEDWQISFPILFQEFEIVELGLQTWLENVDLGNQPCPTDLDCGGESDHQLPPSFEQLRLELGDEAFAEWLVNNQQQSGNLQNVNEAEIEDWRANNPEVFEQFEMTEQVLQGWLDWFQAPQFEVLDIFIDGSSWNVSEFLLPADPTLDLTLPWIGMDQVVVTFAGAEPTVNDLVLTHGLEPIQMEIPVPGVAVWTLPVDGGLGAIDGFSPGGVDNFGIHVGDQVRLFDVVPGDVDGIGHLTDIGDLLELLDPLNPNGIGFATESPVRSDIDGSGLVDIGDLLQIVDHLGAATLPLPPQPAAAPLADATMTEPLIVDDVFAEMDERREATSPVIESTVSNNRGLTKRNGLAGKARSTSSASRQVYVTDEVFALQTTPLCEAF